MLNKIISDKKHTISELRTLRTQGRASIESLQMAFDRQNKVYLAQKLVTENLTKNTKDYELANQRLLGHKDMLDVLKTLLEQSQAKLNHLDNENSKTPKYSAKKKSKVSLSDPINLNKEPHVKPLTVEDVGVQGAETG